MIFCAMTKSPKFCDVDRGARRRRTAGSCKPLFANGGSDNLTCQIVRVDDPESWTRPAIREAVGSALFHPSLRLGSSFEGYRILRELHLSKRTQVYLCEDERAATPSY